MDEYGFQAVNGQSSVTISSVFKLLVFSERGTIRITSKYIDSSGQGRAYFATPIRTQEPPQIFVKMRSASHHTLGVYVTVVGSPGNWTGFQLDSGANGINPLQDHTLDYVVCQFSDDVQVGGYGMNIWDQHGVPLFTSKDKIVKYGKFANSWVMTSDTTDFRSFSPNVTIDEDDYICISAMDRGVNWFTDNAKYAYFNIWTGWAPNLRLVCQRITALGYWYWQGTNNTQFTVAICKFPFSRYTN
ncbi:hypothetical protein [Pseudomonas sp. GZD-222]|uniref:hypothetical protein n=1 Tax=Pseudomonas sp. GZD-222 TaxID=3404805 RepID=UPI003BB7945D